MEKKPLMILAGPTAVGKTKASIALAKAVGGEIISADSMQVYKGMDIGSAKIRPEEMQGVTHHLVDVLDPREPFHVVRFQELAKAAMETIYANGHVPILVGGSGFYIQALAYDIDFTEERGDEALRERLRAYAKEHGAEALHARLREVDPAAADAIHANNVKRVIRALEFFETTHTPISAHNEQERAKTSPYDLHYFVLTDQRETIYKNIDQRVDQMMEDGLEEEVLRLREHGCMRDMISMQGLGYKEMLDYLDGAITREEAVYRIKRDTRHFAKRQLTWFQRERDAIWIDKSAYDHDDNRVLEAMLSYLRR